MNRDGSGLRRLTNHPAIDVTPTWAPAGHAASRSCPIARGSPQIYVVAVDGTGTQRITAESWCDRPTWSPAPYNEIAYTSRTGPGFDIKIIDLSSGERRQVTFGEGVSNESPAYRPQRPPPGVHVERGPGSSRSGRSTRTGRNLRPVTTVGQQRDAGLVAVGERIQAGGDGTKNGEGDANSMRAMALLLVLRGGRWPWARARAARRRRRWPAR